MEFEVIMDYSYRTNIMKAILTKYIIAIDITMQEIAGTNQPYIAISVTNPSKTKDKIQ